MARQRSTAHKAILRSTVRKDMKRHWQLYCILAIPIIMLIIFRYVPMYGVIIAFKNFKVRQGILGSDWVGLKYFLQFFESQACAGVLWNTISISLYSIFASLPFPIILAIGLNEMRNQRFKKTVQMFSYAPYFISTVVLVSMVMQFLDPRIGIVNRIVQLLGGKSINYMAQERYFIHIYVWSGIWKNTGYSAIIFIAALSSVPPELYEAAVIDGASKMQKIRFIDLPFILPTVAIILILNFGQVMNVGFEKVYLMQNSANMSASEVISTYVYKVGLINMNMSYSSAVNLFNSVINMALLLIVNAVAGKVSDTSLF